MNGTYTPRIAPDTWSQISDFVTEAVAACAGKTAYSDRELLIAASQLVAWSHDVAGNNLDRDEVFHRRTISRFVAVGLPGLAPASRGNYRSRLLRMAEILAPVPTLRRMRPLPPSSPMKPYSLRQLASLRDWASAQSTPARVDNARVLLSLGLGAGLSALEIGTTVVDQLEVGDGVIVHVHGERPRDVPVLAAWEDALIARAEQLPDGAFVFREQHTTFYPNLISNFVARSGPGLHPQTARMRSTWLVRHLEAGTPVRTLIEAAGVTSLEALTRYLQFAEAPGADAARRALRGLRTNAHK